MIGPINEGYRTVCGNSAYVWALTGQEAISELPFASFSKRDLVLNHSYENEINLHVNEKLLSKERLSTRTRFENDAKGNSEMAYYRVFSY